MASAQPKPEAQAGSKRSGPVHPRLAGLRPLQPAGRRPARRGCLRSRSVRRKPGESVQWKPVPKTGMVNLAAMFPGKTDCAAYLKTEIVSPQDCDATLLLGSDDGVKAWLNGTVVHSNNIDRGAVPDQDTAPIKLKKRRECPDAEDHTGRRRLERLRPDRGAAMGAHSRKRQVAHAAHTTGRAAAETRGASAARRLPETAAVGPVLRGGRLLRRLQPRREDSMSWRARSGSRDRTSRSGTSIGRPRRLIRRATPTTS